jgi:T5SS/PEP-CTERM-associated repeat protein
MLLHKNPWKCMSARYAALAAVVASICLVGRAGANVTSIGSVNPVPPAGGGSFPGVWVVGDDQAANPDTRAWALLDDGTSLQYATMIVGDEEDFSGEVTVLGDFLGGLNTLLTLTGSGSSANRTVQVGNEGTGRLNVRGGAMVVLSNNSGDLSIGVEPTGVGYVTVSDPFSILTIGEDLFVGAEGIGHLEVLDGALVRTIDSGSSDAVNIGSGATGVGTAVVDGAGSVLRVGSNLIVGGLGIGTLTIGEQAIVDVDNTSNSKVTVGGAGRLLMEGGTLIGLATTVNGYLGGHGLVRGTVGFSDDSFLETGPGDLLRFSGNVSNQGSVTIDHGEIHFLAGMTNNAIGMEDAPGRITLQNGTVRFAQTLVNDGVLSSAQGTNNIHGEITNQGAIVVASDTVATFHDSVTDNGGTITVLAAGNALFLADVMFDAASLLNLSIGSEGTTQNPAQLGIAGGLALAGGLNVDVDAGYTPNIGDSFELISASGGVTGTFDTTTLPDIPGMLEYGILYNATSVRMEVRLEMMSIELPGDYNGNGVVDAADYTVWRDHLGTGFALNGNGDESGASAGVVDQADYAHWKANFGRTAGSGALSNVAVPEPSSSALLLIAFVALIAGGGRR